MDALQAQRVLSTEAAWAGGVLLLAYAAVIFYYDRAFAARGAGEYLQQRMESLRTGFPGVDREALEATAMLIREATTPQFGRLKFQRNNKILAGWRALHDLERQMLAGSPLPRVKARLSSVGAEMHQLPRHDAHALAHDIDVFFGRVVREHVSVASQHDPRALLHEALRISFDARDTAYEAQDAMETKAVIFGLVGLAMVAIAAPMLHRETFFLMGAIGGFLGRLTRLIRGRPVPKDYGASVTTMLLAPVAGALAGWAGIALLHLAAEAEVLSTATFGGWWNKPTNTSALGLALLLGLSERFFDRLVSLGESTIAGDRAESSTSRQEKDRGTGSPD